MNSGRECDLHCRSGSAGDSQSLHNMQASRLERAESKYTTENYEHKPLGYLPVLWFECLRLEGNDPSRHKLLGFVTYLQHVLRCGTHPPATILCGVHRCTENSVNGEFDCTIDDERCRRQNGYSGPS